MSTEGMFCWEDDHGCICGNDCTRIPVPAPGTRIRTVVDGKRWWTVQVSGDRYAICTRQRPFAPKGDYLYTIMDFRTEVQGPCSLIGNGWDVSPYITPEAGWRDLHIQLLAGRIEISHRQQRALVITETKAGS